jgi:hypothetical protein
MNINPTTEYPDYDVKQIPGCITWTRDVNVKELLD